MLYNNGDQFNQIYYNGKSVSQIWKNGVCIYPGTPYDASKFILISSIVLGNPASMLRVDSLPTDPEHTEGFRIVSENPDYPIYAWGSAGDSEQYWYCKSDIVSTGPVFLIGNSYTQHFTDLTTINTYNMETLPSFRYLVSPSPTVINGRWDLSNILRTAQNVPSRNHDVFDISLCIPSKFVINVANEGFSIANTMHVKYDLGFSVFSFSPSTFGAVNSKIDLLVLRNTETISTFNGSPDQYSDISYLYVPQNLVDLYKSDSKWAWLCRYGLQILPIEGSPYEEPGSVSALYS